MGRPAKPVEGQERTSRLIVIYLIESSGPQSKWRKRAPSNEPAKRIRLSGAGAGSSVAAGRPAYRGGRVMFVVAAALGVGVGVCVCAAPGGAAAGSARPPLAGQL